MNIAKLPENDVPESIWATIERTENTTDGEAERIGYTGDPLSEAVALGEANITNSIPISTR